MANKLVEVTYLGEKHFLESLMADSRDIKNLDLIHYTQNHLVPPNPYKRHTDAVLLDWNWIKEKNHLSQFMNFYGLVAGKPIIILYDQPDEIDPTELIQEEIIVCLDKSQLSLTQLNQIIRLAVEKNQMEFKLQEFQENEKNLRQRLALEELVSSVSTRFVNISLDQVDQEISQALGKVGAYLGVERCYLDKLSVKNFANGGNEIIIDEVFEWCAEGLSPHIEGFKNTSLLKYQWFLSKLLNNENVIIDRLLDMPPESQPEKELWMAQGVQSVLAIPLYQNNSLVGVIGFNCEQAEKRWTHEVLNLIRVIGEIFLNVLQRKQDEETLRYTLSVEELVTGISYRFINASNDQIDSEINRALKFLAQYIRVDRSYFSLISADTMWITKLYTWYIDQDINDTYLKYPMDYLGPYQWGMNQLRKGEPILVPLVADLPEEAAAEKMLWNSQSRQSVLILPLFESGNIVGYIGFDSQYEQKRWSETDILLLKLVGEIFINALVRKRKDDALHESEERYHSLFDAAEDLILVVDEKYHVVAANPSVLGPVIASDSFEKTSSMSDILTLLEADRDFYSELYRQVFENGIPIKFERELSQLDGKCWFSITLSPIRDLNDRVTAVTFIGRDISERVEAEQSLRLHAKRLEMLEAISISLRQAKTVNEMVSITLEQSRTIVEADKGTIYLAIDGVFAPVLTFNWAMPDHKYHPSLSKEIIEKAYQSGQYSFLSINNPEINRTDSQGSIAILPLKTAEATVGVFLLGFSNLDEIPSDIRRMLVAISEMAGSALHRAMIIEGLENRVARLTQELVALYDLTFLAQETIGIEDILELSLGKIQETMNSEAICMHLIENNGSSLKLVAHRGIPRDFAEKVMNAPISGKLSEVMSKNRRELIVGDLTSNRTIPFGLELHGFNSYLGIPMRVKDQILGLLSVYRVDSNLFGIEETSLLSAITDQLGVALENSRLRKCAEEAAVMQERQRLARELHDSVTQLIYSVTLFANLSKILLKNGSTNDLSACLEDIQSTAGQALKEMRLLLFELRPSVLEQEGLLRALKFRLEAVERRAGIIPELIVDHELDISLPLQAEIYRIAIEALNNSLKHASASSVKIQIISSQERLEIEIIDDGKGFEWSGVGEDGMGLSIMRQRAEKLGGSINVFSSPGEGTRVKLVLTKSLDLFPIEE